MNTMSLKFCAMRGCTNETWPSSVMPGCLGLCGALSMTMILPYLPLEMIWNLQRRVNRLFSLSDPSSRHLNEAEAS